MLTATAAHAEPKMSPTDFMKGQMEGVFEILDRDVEPGSPEAQKRVEDMRAIIDALIDYEDLAKRSLGKHWEGRTPEEQAAYVEKFKKIVHLSYVDRIDDGGKRRRDGYSVDWEDESINGSTGTVEALLNHEDTITELNWTLKAHKDAWILHDFEFEGTSVEASYRKNYGKIIEKEGFDGLLKKMDERIQKG